LILEDGSEIPSEENLEDDHGDEMPAGLSALLIII
jgi:hypothetical protein